MAYPYVVDGTDPVTSPAHAGQNPAPNLFFQSGNTRYMLAVDSGPAQTGFQPFANYSHQCRMYRSDDQGVTWTVKDAANGPVTATSSASYSRQNLQNCYGWQSGADVYVTCPDPATLAGVFPHRVGVQVAVFHMGADVWDAAIITGSDLVYETTGFGDGFAFPQFLLAVRPADGALIFFYNGAPDPNGDRGWLQIYSGGAWGAPLQIMGVPADLTSFHPQGIAFDDDSRALLVGWECDNTLVARLLYRTFEASNSLHSIQTLTTNCNAPSATQVRVSPRNTVFLQGEWMVPHQSSRPGAFSDAVFPMLARAPGGSNFPVFTDEEIAPAHDNSDKMQPDYCNFGMAKLGSDLYFFWMGIISLGFQHLLYEAVQTGGSPGTAWSAKSVLFDSGSENSGLVEPLSLLSANRVGIALAIDSDTSSDEDNPLWYFEFGAGSGGGGGPNPIGGGPIVTAPRSIQLGGRARPNEEGTSY